MSRIDAWFARVSGNVGTELYPLDATDTDVGPHVLQAWSDYADASNDPRVRAMASYILLVNSKSAPHALDMVTGINTREATGTPTLEQYNDAETAIQIGRARDYPGAK